MDFWAWIERSQVRSFWSQREEVQNHSRKALIQVRGALIWCFDDNCMFSCYIGWLECAFWSLHWVLSDFWKFPKTAWWCWRPARRLMPPEPFLGFPAMHRLAAKCCPPSDGNCLAQFSRMVMFSWCGDAREWFLWYENLWYCELLSMTAKLEQDCMNCVWIWDFRVYVGIGDEWHN